MDGVPAYCDPCGIAFDVSYLFRGVKSDNMKITNFGVLCPKCGGLALAGDGTYQVRQANAVLVDGPKSTRDLITALRSVVDTAKANNLGAVDILAEVADVSPDLADKLRSKIGLSTIVVLLVILWIAKSVEFNITVDINRLIDQASAIAAEADADQGKDFDPDAFEIPGDAILLDPASEFATDETAAAAKRPDADA